MSREWCPRAGGAVIVALATLLLTGPAPGATAMEEYQIDYARYPSTDGMWVPVRELSSTLSPTYVRELPETDGWGHPLRCWSNERSYIIVSPGKDGETDRNWLENTTPSTSTSFAADIVFKDGIFLQWPVGTLTD